MSILEPVKEAKEFQIYHEAQGHVHGVATLRIACCRHSPAPQSNHWKQDQRNSNDPYNQSGEQNIPDDFADPDDVCFVLKVFHKFDIKQLVLFPVIHGAKNKPINRARQAFFIEKR
jgi:hypothetical protein